MALVVLAHLLQHGDGLLDGWLIHQHRLEAALQRGILLDVLAIFVQGRRANRAQLATRQRWLQQIGRANRALGVARADDGMQLVDEQDHIGILSDLFEHLLDALLKLAAEHRASDHTAHTDRDDARVAQGRGHIALGDPAGDALDDGGLANAWLANQHGIVLLAAAQHRQHAAYLTITPGGGVELAIARLGGQVATELIEGRRLAILVHLVLLALGLGGVTLRLEAQWRLATVLPHHPVEERPEKIVLRSVARRVRQVAIEHLFGALLAEVVLLTATIGY